MVIETQRAEKIIKEITTELRLHFEFSIEYLVFSIALTVYFPLCESLTTNSRKKNSFL